MYVETLEMALSEEQESRIIEMAWEDRTPFEASSACSDYLKKR